MPVLTDAYINFNPKLPKILYHYCSTEAFLSIIENKCIWLSDADSTNDTTELKYVFENFKEILEECLENLGEKCDDNLKNFVRFNCLKVMDNLLSKSVPASQYVKHFLCCFSEAKDLLSQWRAYGNDGKGVAIGFNSELLSSIVCDDTYSFTKVIYQKKAIREFLHNIIDGRLIYILENCMKNDMTEEDMHDLVLEIGILVYSIWQEGFVFKHGSFKEEREWRIYKKTTSSNYSEDEGVDEYGYAGFLDGAFAENNKHMGKFTRSKLKYRATSNNIRPYFEVGFDRCKDELIKEIVLGPKCNISDVNLKLLLVQNKYIDRIDSKSIRISRAEAPYV